MVGIYKITNPTGKIYIGQSVNIEERFGKYNNLNNKRQVKLYNSFKKHGITNHQFEIIEECSKCNLNEREIYWGNHYDVLNNGLNLRLGNGRGSCSKNTRNKISNSLKGKAKSKEHCLNLSISKTGIPSKRKGKPDLKQKGKPKPGAGCGKGNKLIGSGPKTGNSIINVVSGEIYNSIKKCMINEKISKRKMFLLLKNPKSNYKYINKNYYKNKQI